MITLTDELKEFIEENVELIENKEFEKLYSNATIELDSENQGKLSTVLMSIGMDPLNSLNEIPPYYFSEHQDIKTFKIPEHIEVLGEGCFSYSSIENIVIPNGVTEISSYAFYECRNLKTITIPKTVKDIGVMALYPNNCVVICSRGSEAAEYAFEHDLEVEFYD